MRTSVLLLVLYSVLAGSADAEERKAVLVLDGLSYLSFGDKEIYPLQAGTPIPFRIESAKDGSATLRILPDDFIFPAIPLNDGEKALRFGLAAPATGSIQTDSTGSTRMTLDARLRVQLDRPDGSGLKEIAIRFTTDDAISRSLDGKQAIAISGMRIAKGTRAVQLVGVRTNDGGDFPAPGAPVVALLSGVFDTGWIAP